MEVMDFAAPLKALARTVSSMSRTSISSGSVSAIRSEIFKLDLRNDRLD